MNAPARPDFADWLNPMLVKELRQGLRTRVFLTTFILLQAMMLSGLIIGLLIASYTGDSTMSTGLFWAVLYLPLIYIIPLSGLNAISGEIKANTLDPIFLTRLSARRIVAGKWLAKVGQTFLLVSTLLPYALLRYFLGGINVSDELLSLAGMFTASIVLSAVTIGTSPFQTPLIRVLFVLGVVTFSYVGAAGAVMVFSGIGAAGGAPGMAWSTISVLLVSAGLFVCLVLEVGASKIAPPVENHARAIRLIALGFFALALLGAILPNPEASTLITLALASLALIHGLAETPCWTPGIYQPLAKRGPVARTIGKFFYSGWPSALLFSLAILAAYSALMASLQMLDDPEKILLWVSFCGTILTPFAFIRLFIPNTANPFLWFVGLQTAALFSAGMIQALDTATSATHRVFSALIPTCSLCITGFNNMPSESQPIALLLTGGVTLMSALILCFLTRGHWKRIRQIQDAPNP